MVVIDASFNVPQIPEAEKYAGTDVDPNVLALLPQGSKVKWSESYGASFWAVSHKITTTRPDGSEEDFFLKLFLHERGREMVEGEYEATKAWYDIVPDNVPEPIGWGEYATRTGIFFVMLRFRNMDDEMPGPKEFVNIVAKVHQESKSPTGKFGFPVTTFSGDIAYDNRWCDTWEEWFSRAMRSVQDREIGIQGPHPELQMLGEKVLAKVIPRLLRPLETEGRSLKPSLVHADLWHGNVGIDQDTEEPVFYDCGALYAHCEFEMGMWNAARYRTNKVHQKIYAAVASLSEPVDESEDRNILYAARCDLAVSCMWPANKNMRELALGHFRYLVEKYGDGYEGYIARANRAAFDANAGFEVSVNVGSGQNEQPQDTRRAQPAEVQKATEAVS